MLGGLCEAGGQTEMTENRAPGRGQELSKGEPCRVLLSTEGHSFSSFLSLKRWELQRVGRVPI